MVKKVKNTKKIGNSILAIVIAALLLISMLALLSDSVIPNAKAQSTSGISSSLTNDEMASPAGNDSRSFVGQGPGVTTPNLEWTADIPGVTVEGFSSMTAFGGLVFVQNETDTIALNAATGSIVYTIPLPYTLLYGGALSYLNTVIATEPIDIGGGYMLVGSNAYSVATGTLTWTAPAGFSAGQEVLSGGGALVTDPQYLPAPMFFAGGCGWELTNPAQPPTVLWNDTGKAHVPSGSGSAYDDGVMVYVGAGQTFQGFDATTGAYLWTAPVRGSQTYGATATQGVFAFGEPDGDLDGWNITTGQLMYVFNPNTAFDYWSWSLGSGYGMIYGHNQNAHFYAVNATTGKLVWDQTSTLFDASANTTYLNGIAYSGTFTMAGGYVYTEMGENQYHDPTTGLFGQSEFDCYNAYNGSLVWSLPYENGAPDNLQCNAYGNLYMIPTTSSATSGVYHYTSLSSEGGTTLGQVICLGNGTAQNWPMYGNDPAHTSSGWGPTNLKVLWNRGWGSGGYLAASPSFADGIGYVGSSDHNIYAFNASTGDEIWNFTTKAIVQSTVAISNGNVYTGADDGNVYCLNAAIGNKIWSTQLSATPAFNLGFGTEGTGGPPSPMIVGNNLYIAANNYVYDLSTSTGSILWNFTWGTADVIGTPTIVNNVLYIAPDEIGPNGFLYEINAQTGGLLLNVTLPYAVNPFINVTPLATVVGPNGQGIIASPTVDTADNLVLVRQVNGYTYAINATSGTIVWLYNATYNHGTPEQWGTENVGSLLYVNGIDYFSDYFSIVAVNAQNGTVIWSTYLSREDDAQLLSYSQGSIYACSNDGYLYVLNAASGAKESFAYVSAGELGATPVPYDGNVYVASGDWNITCFTQAAAAVAVTPTATPTPTPTPTIAPIAPTATPLSLSPLGWSLLYVMIVIIITIIVAVAVVGALVLRTLKKRTQ